MKKVLAVTLSLAFLGAFASKAGAEVLDLQSVGASGDLVGAVGGTALFEQGRTGSGTGVFPAFVQIVGNNPVKEGYNTTANNVLDNGSSPQHNHEITLGSVEVVVRGGVSYYQFILDANEVNNASDRYISLDDLIVVTSTTPNQSQTDPHNLGTVRWEMNAPTDHILLDYNLESGSGFGDMRFLVPVSAFQGALSSNYVYLYSKFGVLGTNCASTGSAACKAGGNYGASDGFEEWAYNLGSTVVVPDGGSTIGLLGLAMLGVGFLRRRLF
jgi:hypothetical protein